MRRGDIEIRPFRRTDAPALARAITESRAHLEPWLPWVAAEPQPLEARQALIDNWERQAKEGGDFVFGIFLDGQVIGGCGLHHRIGPDGVEIGYWLHVDHTGRGYMTTAAAALTDIAFEDPAVAFVEIHHDVTNARSRAVPERLGYTLRGEFDRPDRGLGRAPAETGRELWWRQDRDGWTSPASPPA